MTDPAQLRLALSARNAVTLAADPRLAASIVTGSVARGHADADSDVDLISYWRVVPSDAEREAFYAAMGATDGGPYGRDADGVAEWRTINGVRCDFGHLLLAGWERYLDDVLLRHTLDGDSHKMASGVSDAHALVGQPLVAGWQARLADFPPGLAEAIARANLDLPSLWALEHRVLARDGLVMYHERVGLAVRKLLNVLCGLDGVYLPGDWKRLGFWLAKLPSAPPDAAARIGVILGPPGPEALAALGTLADDVLTLTERRFPDAGVEATRARLRWQP